MRSLEPAATCTASTAPPRRGCHASRLRVNPDLRVVFTSPGNLGRSRSPRPWAAGRLNADNSGWSGRLQRLAAGWCPGRRPGLQPKMREDLLDHRLLKDRRNDLQLAAAVRAVLQIEFEHALEQPRPAQPHRPMVRTVRLALGGWRGVRGRLGLLRHHQRAQLGVGGQQPARRGSGSGAVAAVAPATEGRSSIARAASRCMNSSGDITRCVVPSRHGVLSFSTTCPAALVCTRSLANAGRVMVRHNCSSA